MSEAKNDQGLSSFRRITPLFRPVLDFFGFRSSSSSAGAAASSEGSSTDRNSMGNCLKSPTADDVSLLREGPNSSQSTDQLEQAPPYVQVTIATLCCCCGLYKLLHAIFTKIGLSLSCFTSLLGFSLSLLKESIIISLSSSLGITYISTVAKKTIVLSKSFPRSR